MKTKIKKIDEIHHTLANDPSASTIFTNLKNNKKSFNQTNLTEFSQENTKTQNNNITKTPYNKTLKKISLNTPLRKNGSSTFPNNHPLISVSVPKDISNNKVDYHTKINSLLPMNIGAFQHLMTGNVFGIIDNMNWAFGLRSSGNLTTKGKDKAHGDKVTLTEAFKEPSFYVDDLQKYKKKQKKGNDKIAKLNPNFEKIKHLVVRNKTGNTNYSQFNFSACLRDYNKNEENKQKEKKWILLCLPKIESDKNTVKCLSPVTSAGIENVKKLRQIMPKNYEVKYEDAYVGDSKIKKKILINNRSFTVSGYGECLGDKKYDNKFRDKNIYANKGLLKIETNPLCKFELGLRNYSYKKK